LAGEPLLREIPEAGGGSREEPALEPQEGGCCGVLSRDKSLEEAGERKGGAFLTGKCLALRAVCLEKREPCGRLLWGWVSPMYDGRRR